MSLDGPGGEFCLFTDRNDASGFNQKCYCLPGNRFACKDRVHEAEVDNIIHT